MRVASVGACLLIANGVAIAVFGLVALVAPGRFPADVRWVRSLGASDVALGLVVVGAAVAAKRGSAIAWWSLWTLPVFWLAHLLWGLPPGRDHVHQVALGLLAVAGLALAAPGRKPHEPAPAGAPR